MNHVAELGNVERIISDIDRLISEMSKVRSQVVALASHDQTQHSFRSVKDADWFGMWADREDMEGLSSREWLTQLRAQQWGR